MSELKYQYLLDDMSNIPLSIPGRVCEESIWRYPTLIKMGQNGATYTYVIFFEESSGTIIKFYTRKSTKEYEELVEVKRNNTLQEQACTRSNRIFQDKVRSGYQVEGSNMDPNFIGMKCKKFETGKIIKKISL